MNNHTEDEKTPFRITDASTLHWSFRKLRELKGEIAKKEDLAQVEYDLLDAERKLVDEWKESETKALKDSYEHFERLVNVYHMETMDKDPKQKTLSTPFGKSSSITTKEQPEKPDKGNEEKLMKYLKDNELTALIKVEETARWGELKKTLKVVGSNVVDKNGEILDCVKVKPETTTWKVELL